jgi:hypothetical protein
MLLGAFDHRSPKTGSAACTHFCVAAENVDVAAGH